MRGCIHCDNPFVSMLFDDEFESICHLSCKMFSTMNRRVCVKGGRMRNHDAHGILGTVMDSYISWSIIRTFKIWCCSLFWVSCLKKWVLWQSEEGDWVRLCLLKKGFLGVYHGCMMCTRSLVTSLCRACLNRWIGHGVFGFILTVCILALSFYIATLPFENCNAVCGSPVLCHTGSTHPLLQYSFLLYTCTTICYQ